MTAEILNSVNISLNQNLKCQTEMLAKDEQIGSQEAWCEGGNEDPKSAPTTLPPLCPLCLTKTFGLFELHMQVSKRDNKYTEERGRGKEEDRLKRQGRRIFPTPFGRAKRKTGTTTRDCPVFPACLP